MGGIFCGIFGLYFCRFGLISADCFAFHLDAIREIFKICPVRLAIAGRLRLSFLAYRASAEFSASRTPLALTRDMSYIVEAAVALMRVSNAAAFKARPPQPQIPITPIRSESTFYCTERKSTAACSLTAPKGPYIAIAASLWSVSFVPLHRNWKQVYI